MYEGRAPVVEQFWIVGKICGCFGLDVVLIFRALVVDVSAIVVSVR